jgi:hypothetical protein
MEVNELDQEMVDTFKRPSDEILERHLHQKVEYICDLHIVLLAVNSSVRSSASEESVELMSTVGKWHETYVDLL